MLDTKQFWKVCKSIVVPRAAAWGFQAHNRGIFLRDLKEFCHGFAIVTSRHGPDAFYVLVGLHLPFLHDRTVFIDQHDYPSFEISHRLGTYRDDGKLIGLDEWYACSNEKQLHEECERMLQHLEGWAFPWYERFRTMRDVAAEFYQLRISDQIRRPNLPDPFAWALYGWMLEVSNKHDESQHWLKRAYDEVTKPLFIKDGRGVRQDISRAKSVRHSEVEERLAELLRQSLKLPVRAPF